MTKAALRSKVHTYIDEADTQVLCFDKAQQPLRLNSLTSEQQQQEVRERSALYKAGKIKGLSIAEAREHLK